MGHPLKDTIAFEDAGRITGPVAFNQVLCVISTVTTATISTRPRYMVDMNQR